MYKHWTFDTVIIEANKYTCRSDFAKYSRRAYDNAVKHGMIDYLFPKRIPRRSKSLATLEQLQSIRPVVPLN